MKRVVIPAVLLAGALAACAQLRLPINIHVAEDRWMYEPMDQTNDGLMNAWTWRVANTPDVLQHDALVETLERAVHHGRFGP